MPSNEQLLYQTEKSSHWKFSMKMLFLKILQYSRGKHLCGILKNTSFEEHLRTAASELTFWSDCLELCFWIAFKTISTQLHY